MLESMLKPILAKFIRHIVLPHIKPFTNVESYTRDFG